VAAAAITVVAFGLALGVGATALVIATLLVGVGAALWQARAAARERDYALNLLSRTEGVVEFLNLLITEAAQSQRPVTVSDLLARSEALAVAAFRHAPEQQALVLCILGLQHMHLEEGEQAEALLKRAGEVARDSSDASFTARLDCEHAVSLVALGRLDEARTRLLVIAGRTDIDAGTAALCLHYLSHVAAEAREGPTAVGYARQSLEKLKSSPRASPTVEAEFNSHLATALALCGRFVEADQVFEKVLARFTELGRATSPVTTLIRTNRAVIHSNSGDPRAALALYDENFALIAQRGDGGPSTTLLRNRALALHALGRVDAAIESYRLALTAAERLGAPRDVRNNLTSLAIAALDTGKIDDAQQLLERVEGVGAGALPADVHELGQWHVVRGRLALAKGQFEQAREEFTAVIEARRPANITLIALSRRAELGLQEGNLDAALQDANDAMDLGRKLQGGGPYSWRTGDASLLQGCILARQGDARQARAAYETALAHFSNTVDPSHAALRQLRQLLADAK
jgi:serine/threonine-protein kinase